MPLLIIQESGHPPRLFEIRLPRLKIGRAPDNDLLLPNVSISRLHAELELGKDGAAVLWPRSESNPVMVNDQAVSGPTRLKTGDSARLGKFKLTFMHEDDLDMFKVQQLAELPRFNRQKDGGDHDTHALPAGLQRKLIEAERLRELGALSPAGGGEIYRLGTELVQIGPDDAVPCEARWGKRTAATVTWAGSGHEIKLVGLFAKLLVNGEAVKDRVLHPGDSVDVNGTVYEYGTPRKRR
jgi:hypothetical protein